MLSAHHHSSYHQSHPRPVKFLKFRKIVICSNFLRTLTTLAIIPFTFFNRIGRHTKSRIKFFKFFIFTALRHCSNQEHASGYLNGKCIREVVYPNGLGKWGNHRTGGRKEFLLPRLGREGAEGERASGAL